MGLPVSDLEGRNSDIASERVRYLSDLERLSVQAQRSLCCQTCPHTTPLMANGAAGGLAEEPTASQSLQPPSGLDKGFTPATDPLHHLAVDVPSACTSSLPAVCACKHMILP